MKNMKNKKLQKLKTSTLQKSLMSMRQKNKMISIS